MKRWINILLNLFLALVVLIAFWLFSQVFLLASFRIPRNWSKGISWRSGNRRSAHGCSTSTRRCGWNRPRYTAHRISENKAGRRAGLQLPASQRLGQDRDAYPEILHQTVYRIAGRHAFHPERKVPDKRHERTAREHGFAGTHRADVAGRVSGRCL